MANARKILIVDDDTDLRDTLVEQLSLHDEFEASAVDTAPKVPLQPKEYLAKYAAIACAPPSQFGWGSTLGCAECHDHKFDPFLARDFYSMKAFFADIKETGLVPDAARRRGARCSRCPRFHSKTI